jgi:3'-5' exoribonuclease
VPLARKKIVDVTTRRHADGLHVKPEMYARCLARDSAEGAFTDREPVPGRQLYGGHAV